MLCIAGLVVLVAILNDWWKQRQTQELQLRTLQTQLGELHRTIRHVRSDLSLEKRYLHLREQEPSRWTSPLEWYRWNKEMEMLGSLIDKKNAEIKKLRQEKDRLVRQVQTSSDSLYRTRQLLTSTLRKSVKTILILCAILFLGPICWRAFWYFVVAGLAKHASPIQLEKFRENGAITVEPSRKNVAVLLQPGERLLTRMAWLHQYTPAARKRTKFLMNWKSPFISYAAGLAELTEVTVPRDATPTEVSLSSAENPDNYLCEVNIHDHPGIVIYPTQVVALTGNLQLKTQWNLLNLHSWIAGRLRYILFSGTGRLYVRGSGGLESLHINGQPVRLSEPIVIAFDASLSFSTVRTETFWPYYRRLVPLFDYQFEGNGLVLRQIASDTTRMDSSTIRIFDTLLNGVGKLLGL